MMNARRGLVPTGVTPNALFHALAFSLVALTAACGGVDDDADGPQPGDVGGDSATDVAEDVGDADDDADDDAVDDTDAADDTPSDVPPDAAPDADLDAVEDTVADTDLDVAPDAVDTDTADATDADAADADAADAETTDAGETAWIELGAGTDTYRRLEANDVVRIFEGPQGGYHIWAALRGQGFDPDEVTIEARARNAEDATVAAGAREGTSGPGGFTLEGPYLQLLAIYSYLNFDVIPEEVDEETWTLCVSVYDDVELDLSACQPVVVDCCEYL